MEAYIGEIVKSNRKGVSIVVVELFDRKKMHNDINVYETCFFSTLKIGDEFILISKKPRPIDNDLVMVYKKTSNSKAECLEQIGYGNNRLEGSTGTFSANSRVFIKVVK